MRHRVPIRLDDYRPSRAVRATSCVLRSASNACSSIEYYAKPLDLSISYDESGFWNRRHENTKEGSIHRFSPIHTDGLRGHDAELCPLPESVRRS
jgi:hypothetical protein